MIDERLRSNLILSDMHNNLAFNPLNRHLKYIFSIDESYSNYGLNIFFRQEAFHFSIKRNVNHLYNVLMSTTPISFYVYDISNNIFFSFIKVFIKAFT